MGKGLGAQWDDLCEYYEAAKKRAFDAQAVLTSKFAAIAKGERSANPTMDELKAAEQAWNEFERAKRAMNNFIKQHQ